MDSQSINLLASPRSILPETNPSNPNIDSISQQSQGSKLNNQIDNNQLYETHDQPGPNNQTIKSNGLLNQQPQINLLNDQIENELHGDTTISNVLNPNPTIDITSFSQTQPILKNLVQNTNHQDISCIKDRPDTPLGDTFTTEISSITPQISSHETEDYCHSYKLKAITFSLPNQSQSHLKILCQNQNGPCPLIALCNALILSNSISFQYDLTFVSFLDIQQILVEHFLTLNKELDLDILLKLLAQCQVGMNLNVLFDGSVESSDKVNEAMNNDKDIDLFRVFDVELVHGWSIDPQDEELYRVGVTLLNGYNGAMLLICQQQELNTKPTRSQEEEEVCHDATVIDSFLKDSPGQMTVYGLVCLVERVKEEVCILFRNNHFLALIKYQGSLFTLVTDQGYEDNSEIVWETLDNCDGDSIFMTSDFQVCKREKVMSAQDPLTPDQDEIFAKSLQIEQEYQEEIRIQAARSKTSNSNSRLDSQSKKDKKNVCLVQ